MAAGHFLRPRCRASLLFVTHVTCAIAGTAAPLDKYVAALRKELHISLPNANHTALERGLLRAAGSIPSNPRSLLLVVPPKYVLTVQKALGSVTYINKCALQLPKTLPRHFVLAAWVLQDASSTAMHELPASPLSTAAAAVAAASSSTQCWGLVPR